MVTRASIATAHAVAEPGCCPFGQEEKRLDDDFVEEQLAKLHLNSDITRAKENIRRARAIIQSW